MANDYLAVFLHRWDDGNGQRGASHVGFGEARQIVQHYPSTVIGVATRPVGEPIEHYDSSAEYESDRFDEWREHVESVADDVRWFDDPLECNPDD